MSAGRVPAMINFTAGAANILAACKAAQLDTIVTSTGFRRKGAARQSRRRARRRKSASSISRISARPSASPTSCAGCSRAGKPLVTRKPDDWAAILFTSGSEGVPKGVVLSHRNMLANVAQASARIDFGREDKVFNVLPVFHSFGLTVGVVLPLCAGVPVYLYPSPLHYRNVPELIYGVNATIVFGTDTFLNGYARAAHAYDFRSVRYILAGAEPVKESTRQIYLEKFGAAHSRRLRRHRDGAGAGAQHADVQQVRHRRPLAAGHGRRGSTRSRASRRAAGFSCAGRT